MRTIKIGFLCVLLALAACEAADGAADTNGGGGGGSDTSGGGSTDPDIGRTFTSSITAAEGGTLATDSNVASLAIPGGALTEDTELTLAVGAGTSDTASAIYSFGPDGLSFQQPATLTIIYEGDPGEGNEAVIAVRDGDTWTKVAGSQRSGVAVTAPVEHFSDFAIVITAKGAVQKGECDELADTFSPCGGDVVGAWTIDTMCIYWDPEDNPLTGEGSPFEQCPDLVFSADVDWVGTYTLTADTLTADVERIVATQRWEIPLSCMNEQYTCAALDENMEDASCTDDGTTCSCEGEQVMGENQQYVQSYEVSGSTFTAIEEDGSRTELEYCISGTTAIFHFPEPEDGWSTGDPEWMILEKR